MADEALTTNTNAVHSCLESIYLLSCLRSVSYCIRRTCTWTRLTLHTVQMTGSGHVRGKGGSIHGTALGPSAPLAKAYLFAECPIEVWGPRH